jgi:hypothetical protein
MKLTRGHSCVLCQQRKVRCDKQKPCANCVKAQVECRVVPPQPPRRRRKKPHERELIDRLKKYESLLAQHGVNFEPIADDLKASDNAEDVADLGQDLSTLKTSPESSAPTEYNQGDGDEKSGDRLLLNKLTRLSSEGTSLTADRSNKYLTYFHGVSNAVFPSTSSPLAPPQSQPRDAFFRTGVAPRPPPIMLLSSRVTVHSVTAMRKSVTVTRKPRHIVTVLN